MTQAEVEAMTEKLDIHDQRGDAEKAVGSGSASGATTPTATHPSTPQPTFGDEATADRLAASQDQSTVVP